MRYLGALYINSDILEQIGKCFCVIYQFYELMYRYKMELLRRERRMDDEGIEENTYTTDPVGMYMHSCLYT